ncbi:hypothetical protein CBR_g19906 [Chara braunii]|uniref:CCHC-type domain-containing protein n=1 Tax=Chara braunii TaxID=69332 RepID=A0A388KZ92_CHABU|nr:hypothetical protein CBR_g19906 [Chara braunii]|eukprot:GBG75273.1 hypothetical protein CBR_g19906 [Chara braunii]
MSVSSGSGGATGSGGNFGQGTRFHPMLGKKCYMCGEADHFASVCEEYHDAKARGVTFVPPPPRPRLGRTQSVHGENPRSLSADSLGARSGSTRTERLMREYFLELAEERRTKKDQEAKELEERKQEEARLERERKRLERMEERKRYEDERDARLLRLVRGVWGGGAVAENKMERKKVKVNEKGETVEEEKERLRREITMQMISEDEEDTELLLLRRRAARINIHDKRRREPVDKLEGSPPAMTPSKGQRVGLMSDARRSKMQLGSEAKKRINEIRNYEAGHAASGSSILKLVGQLSLSLKHVTARCAPGDREKYEEECRDLFEALTIDELKEEGPLRIRGIVEALPTTLKLKQDLVKTFKFPQKRIKLRRLQIIELVQYYAAAKIFSMKRSRSRAKKMVTDVIKKKFGLNMNRRLITKVKYDSRIKKGQVSRLVKKKVGGLPLDTAVSRMVMQRSRVVWTRGPNIGEIIHNHLRYAASGVARCRCADSSLPKERGHVHFRLSTWEDCSDIARNAKNIPREWNADCGERLKEEILSSIRGIDWLNVDASEISVTNEEVDGCVDRTTNKGERNLSQTVDLVRKLEGFVRTPMDRNPGETMVMRAEVYAMGHGDERHVHPEYRREREAAAAARAVDIADQVALLRIPEANADRFQEELAAAVAALVRLRTLEDFDGPMVDKRAATLPSKYDGKADITSWISSMRSYFEVMRTPQEDRSMIMGTNTESAVRNHIELQAVAAGYACIDLTNWLKVIPVRTLEDLLLDRYQDKHAALKARLKLEALKGQTWRSFMQALEQHLTGLFTTPDLGMTDVSCMDAVMGVAPKEYLSLLALKDHATWRELIKDLVDLEAKDLARRKKAPVAGGKPQRKRFGGSNQLARHDHREADDQSYADDLPLDDDLEPDSDTGFPSSAREISTLKERNESPPSTPVREKRGSGAENRPPRAPEKKSRDDRSATPHRRTKKRISYKDDRTVETIDIRGSDDRHSGPQVKKRRNTTVPRQRSQMVRRTRSQEMRETTTILPADNRKTPMRTTTATASRPAREPAKTRAPLWKKVVRHFLRGRCAEKENDRHAMAATPRSMSVTDKSYSTSAPPEKQTDHHLPARNKMRTEMKENKTWRRSGDDPWGAPAFKTALLKVFQMRKEGRNLGVTLQQLAFAEMVIKSEIEQTTKTTRVAEQIEKLVSIKQAIVSSLRSRDTVMSFSVFKLDRSISVAEKAAMLFRSGTPSVHRPGPPSTTITDDDYDIEFIIPQSTAAGDGDRRIDSLCAAP